MRGKRWEVKIRRKSERKQEEKEMWDKWKDRKNECKKIKEREIARAKRKQNERTLIEKERVKWKNREKNCKQNREKASEKRTVRENKK